MGFDPGNAFHTTETQADFENTLNTGKNKLLFCNMPYTILVSL